MKFRLDRDALADAVGWAARVLPARPSTPVLAGLRVEAAGGQVTFSGFDYEVFGQSSVPADIADDGAAMVSGRLLAEISRSLPAGKPVDVVADGGKVVVTCSSSRFTLLTLPLEDAPTLPQMPAAAGTVAAAELAHAVAQVAVAAGRDDMLPALTGIRVEIDGETITMAATDRYRLAVRELTWAPTQPSMSAVALVPARTLAETAKALSGPDDVTLALQADDDAQALLGLEGGGRRSTTRLLDGEFPKYRSLFPAEAATRSTVDTAALVEAVRRVALVAERNTPVRLAFGADEVVLEAGTGDDAQASEAVPAQTVGEGLTIGFNPGYLLDGLGALGTPRAVFAFTHPTKPAVLQGESAEAAGTATAPYRYLLMPVRLSS